MLAIAYFSIIFPIYTISFWLPTLLKEQGVNDTIQLGWYAAIPYVAAAVGMNLAGRHSDKVGERRYHCAIPALAAAACLIAAIFTDGNLTLTLVALTFATACLWMAYTVFWAIPSQLIEGTAAAGGIALINTVGLLGGFWGPARLRLDQDVDGEHARGSPRHGRRIDGGGHSDPVGQADAQESLGPQFLDRKYFGRHIKTRHADFCSNGSRVPFDSE